MDLCVGCYRRYQRAAKRHREDGPDLGEDIELSAETLAYVESLREEMLTDWRQNPNAMYEALTAMVNDSKKFAPILQKKAN